MKYNSFIMFIYQNLPRQNHLFLGKFRDKSFFRTRWEIYFFVAHRYVGSEIGPVSAPRAHRPPRYVRRTK